MNGHGSIAAKLAAASYWTFLWQRIKKYYTLIFELLFVYLVMHHLLSWYPNNPESINCQQTFNEQP